VKSSVDIEKIATEIVDSAIKVHQQLGPEDKVVEHISPVHEAQLLTYLKLKGCWLGFLLNWNVMKMKYGIKRYAYGSRPDHP